MAPRIDTKARVALRGARVELERQQLADPKLAQLQEAMARAVDSLATHPMASGKILSGIEIEGPDDEVSVQHGLGKVPTGWTVVDRDTDARVWRTSWTAREIVLRASARVTVSIHLFA